MSDINLKNITINSAPGKPDSDSEGIISPEASPMSENTSGPETSPESENTSVTETTPKSDSTDSTLLTETREWRNYFSDRDLATAQNFLNRENYFAFNIGDNWAEAYVGTSKSFHAVIGNAPTCFSENWNVSDFSCTCSAANPRPSRWYVTQKETCSHEAAVLLLWEQLHGKWTFTETAEEKQERLKKEAFEAEKKRRAKLKEKEENIPVSSDEWHFEPQTSKESLFFDIPKAAAHWDSSMYAIHSGEEYVKAHKTRFDKLPEIIFDSDGDQALECRTITDDPFDPAATSITISCNEITNTKCSCRRRSYSYYYDEPEKLCGHQLSSLSLLWEYVNAHNPGDATDRKAEKLFSILDGNAAFEPEEEETAPEKKPVISISPRLVIQEKSIALTLKIGKPGCKEMILKGFRKLQEAMDAGESLSFGKNLTVDFASETVTPESELWLNYISGRINDADRLNNKLAASRYGYYGRSVSVQSSEQLSGALLDQFYSMAEGMDIEYEDKRQGKKGILEVGPTRGKVRLCCTGLRSSSNHLQGVKIDGTMPLILKGQGTYYIVSDNSLGVLSNAAWAAMKPFNNIANANGNIHFQVGKGRLAEFYYRVVPGLLNSPYIDFQDEADADISFMLPPEPVFTFRLDIINGMCVAQCQVSYDEAVCSLPLDDAIPADEYHDLDQENRVMNCMHTYFPHTDSVNKIWYTDNNDDAIYAVMLDGIRELNKYGEVVGTDAFFSRSIRPAPQIHFNVSVDSGLLDIELLSKDITREELQDVYDSYRKRKRYHRLTDGSFISISDNLSFESMEQLADRMNLSMEALLADDIRMPLFRALYLDSLLEEHDDLAANRDKTYRALIKGFRTIRDADYDVPEHMSDILRPYQVYGHKWMRTVAEAGFGGILADEMGLGKTLETISVISAMKQENRLESALVVCPASLVYNWEEEIHKFSPELSVICVAGNTASRKKVLSLTDTDSRADIYVTSYDLLRKDIDIYKDKHFTLMVIDEAQYIKNQNAAMTKAVKIVHADKRMALTGTPIENRLAELWSIFDFLMPGFLYDYHTFSENLEIPVTKHKDEEATARLRQMVQPFILRRKKEDVLKDLPPKLEEIRYARFEKKQREIYDAQVLQMKGMLHDSSGKGQDRIRILAELTHIRQICCDPSLLFENYNGESAKRSACIELIRNAIGGGHRMLLFSQFTSMLELLEKDLNSEKIPYYKITGATPKEKRLRDIHAFNEGDVPVFLISLKAGGTGLNLTGADMVIHYDPWWNLAAQNQATDRAHRIGQQKTVTVYRLIAKDTIEEKILELQEAKKDLADAVLSGEQSSLMSLSEEELLELLG